MFFLGFLSEFQVTEIVKNPKDPDCKMSKPVFVKDPTECTKEKFKKVGKIRSLYFQYPGLWFFGIFV